MELTSQQKKAVEHREGPLLILAGAGTGKTMVITHRIAHLIETKKARPEEILALTFTEKAAKEMEERVDQLVPYGYTDVWISTFHAFGDRILRDHAIPLGLPPTFRVLSRPEQIIFLRQQLFKLPLKRFRPLGNPTKHLQALLGIISRAKDEDASPSEYLSYAEKCLVEAQLHPENLDLSDEASDQLEIAKTYEKYQELMSEAGLIDFGDQVSLLLRLFRTHPAVLTHYRRKFRYILVDEFQDTNHSQYQLIKHLALDHRNITVVGDDDQSIYRFRGAAMSNILMFLQDWSDARQVVLTENRRSNQAILDSAYRLIRFNDPERLEVKSKIDKRLIAKKNGTTKNPVQHLHYDTLSAETDGVASLIERRVEEDRWSYSDVAILVRANNDADAFTQSLNFHGIPWRFSGSRGLYSLPEIRRLIAFLKILADPHASPSLYYLASSPLYQMPMTDLIQCNRLCRRQHISLYSVFRRIERKASSSESSNPQYELSDFKSQLSLEGQATLIKLLNDIASFQEHSRKHSVGVVLYEFFKQSGWLADLSDADSPKTDVELQNIAKFFDCIQKFENLSKHPTVPSFVEYQEALIEAGDDPPTAQADSDSDAVNVLTIHRAKGLEFPVVFLASLVEQKFPSRNRSETIPLPAGLIKEFIPSGNIHLQEERRLFYVGMTRAMNELYLTSARDYGTQRERKISRFIVEALDLHPKTNPPVKSSPLEVIKRHASPSAENAPQPGLLSSFESLSLSYYKIDDYLTCPLKYKYTHILHMPIYRHHAIIYGAALHQAVAAYLRTRIHQQPFGLKDLLAVFEKEWHSEGFISREHEEQRYSTGLSVLERFYLREEAKDSLPKEVEQSFRFSVGNNIVIGRWDRIDEKDEEATVIDYKSSELTSQEKADRQAGESLQLSIYATAYQSKTGRLPKEVQLHFLESGLVGRAVKTEDDVKETKETILKAAEGIRSQDFAARPTYMACSYCAYREICPHTSFRKES